MYVFSSTTYLPHLTSSYLISSVHSFHSCSNCTLLQAGDGRDVSCPVITVPSGNEPSMFTAHFLVRYLTPHPRTHSHCNSLTLLLSYSLICSLTHTRSHFLSLTHSLLSSLLSSFRLQYSVLILNRIFSDINPFVFLYPPPPPFPLLLSMLILFLSSYLFCLLISVSSLSFILFYLQGWNKDLAAQGKFEDVYEKLKKLTVKTA